MDLLGLKAQHIRTTLGITAEDFPNVIAFVDFGNVNHWFDDDDKDGEGNPLPTGTRLNIDLAKLRGFLALFSKDIRFYYGHDPANPGSMAFLMAAKHTFGKNRVFTKPIQKIRHYLSDSEATANTRAVATDPRGQYVLIPKCNFDVEISVDAIRLSSNYETICLLSSDADFASLLRHLKTEGKKTVLVKGGRITASLGTVVDLKINAQEIKKDITVQKAKTRRVAGPCGT